MDPYPEAEREALFEKPLTPSDVGKLNRLVIPKHHAEKHFPLGVDLAERGLLLNFEDESERQWLFRYSYWSSSQSYVLTKGWSGFVKDKQLDAGDVVSFHKHRVEGDRLFIRWRRNSAPINGGGAAAVYYGQHPYPPPYPPGFLHPGGGSGSGGAAAVKGGRRVRLFGVNLDSDPGPPLPHPQGKVMRRHGLGSEEVVGRWDGSPSSSSSTSWR